MVTPDETHLEHRRFRLSPMRGSHARHRGARGRAHRQAHPCSFGVAHPIPAARATPASAADATPCARRSRRGGPAFLHRLITASLVDLIGKGHLYLSAVLTSGISRSFVRELPVIGI